MSGFSIELLEEGYRAVDPLTRVRFVVKRAPDDMPVTAPLAKDGKAGVAPSPPSIPPPSITGSTATKSVPPRPTSEKSNGTAAAKATPSPDATKTDDKKPSTALGGAAATQTSVAAPAPLLPVGAFIPGLPSVKVLSQREQNPTTASPLTYREYSFAVASGTSEDVAANVLKGQLRLVDAHLEGAKMGKLVNLAVFDVEFTGKPPGPPLATLTWKDWKGDPVIGFPRRGGGTKQVKPPTGTSASTSSEPPASISSPPSALFPPPSLPGPSFANPTAPTTTTDGPTALPPSPAVPPPIAFPPPSAQTAPAQINVPVPPFAATAEPISPPVAAAPAPAPPDAAPPASTASPKSVPARAPDKLPSQPPGPPRTASGAFKAAAMLSPGGSVPPPAISHAPTSPSRRPSSPDGMVRTPSGRFVRGRTTGDELITALFESMHDLHFLRDALDGGQFCLALATEVLPARVALIHFFDIEKREWVIACTRGKDTTRMLTTRTPESDELLRSAARKRRAVVLSNASTATAARYASMGGSRSIIIAPIMQAGRALGAMELINPLDGMPFNEDEGNAMTYIAEQYAEYLGSRGIVLDRERIQSAAAAPR